MGASGGGDPRQGGVAVFVMIGIPAIGLLVALLVTVPWLLLIAIPVGLWWLLRSQKTP